jgi:thiamine-phosphate pyrophosphorylase
MSHKAVLQKIYPITDTTLSNLSHAEQVERLAAVGASIIQLRDLKASPREFYEATIRAVDIAHKLGVIVVVCGRLDVAMAAQADGVHLTQRDIPVQRVRQMIGEQSIIGLSVRTPEEALIADSAAIDYIALGPLFTPAQREPSSSTFGLAALTESKRKISHPVPGTGGLMTSKPLVAFGGITIDGAKAVIKAGADSILVCSGLYSSGDPAKGLRDYFSGVE